MFVEITRHRTTCAYGISPSRATVIICAHLLRLGQLIGLAASFGPSQSTTLAVVSWPSLGSAASRARLLDVCDMVGNVLNIPSPEVVLDAKDRK